MSNFSLREHIKNAKQKGVAIGHFNISTLDGVWAVADAAQNLGVPVIVGVSEGERDYVGVEQISAVISSIRKSRNQEIFLNADHTYSFDKVQKAIDAGFDAVIFDGAQLSFDENIAMTKKCVQYAKQSGRDVLVEGELGYIGTSSKILDSIPEGAAVKEEQLTKIDDALSFVNETGIDLLAPAVGNIHGVVKGGDPNLNTDRVKEISSTVKIPLVLHGASGNTASDIQESIRNGVAVVHVNTELRIAYRSGLVSALSSEPDELSPYKYLKSAKTAMQRIVEEKIKIFNFIK